MDPRTNASRLYKASTRKDTLNVHNGIWPFLTEVSLNDDGEIVLHRTPANHNLLSPQLAREITNNIYKNAMQTDLTTKTHNESMGKDMHCILTYNEKVRLTTICATCSCSTIREECDKSHHILTLLSLLRYLYFFLQIVKKGSSQQWTQRQRCSYEVHIYQRY